ncbi:MAG: hypothetical protein H7Z73_04800 [Candidatus Saccharibacteria bacterium]|nr:hypothetical protein [Moraxellaceae bacterium]
MKIAFVVSQGGKKVFEFYAAMATLLAQKQGAYLPVFNVWQDSEKSALESMGWSETTIRSFESWVQRDLSLTEEVARIRAEYRSINWSEVIAAERSFTDYSQLLGSAGERQEPLDYVLKLTVNIVRFIEDLLKDRSIKALVCPTADTLFSLIAIKVAQHHGIKVCAVTPAYPLVRGADGGYFSNNEFLESEKMIANYHCAIARNLNCDEVNRANGLIDSIKGFSFRAACASENHSKGSGFSALSPNVFHLFAYLSANAAKNKHVQYDKIDPLLKAKGNVLRVVRKLFSQKFLGSVDVDEIPVNSIFYALHYQPEQSTLAQAIFYANQIALVENISKSLPIGYTLVVKEHPWGRGARPVWQYRHLKNMYNIIFCDAPAKEIIQRVAAVITVTGNVAMESLVFDKPTIVFGRTYFTHCDLLYRVRDVLDLSELLKKILVDGVYAKRPNRLELLQKFLVSFQDSLVPHRIAVINASFYADKLLAEIESYASI